MVNREVHGKRTAPRRDACEIAGIGTGPQEPTADAHGSVVACYCRDFDLRDTRLRNDSRFSIRRDGIARSDTAFALLR